MGMNGVLGSREKNWVQSLASEARSQEEEGGIPSGDGEGWGGTMDRQRVTDVTPKPMAKSVAGVRVAAR